MRSLLTLLILQGLFFISALALAQPPNVSYNVHVLQNATRAQCPSSWRGRVAPEEMQESVMGGEYSMGGPGILSCTGCRISSQSQDCVCRTCYDYSNGY